MYFSKCIFLKCFYPKCIFAKCTRLACLLSFASLFHEQYKSKLCKPPCTQTTYDVRPTQMNNRSIMKINFDFDLEVNLNQNLNLNLNLNKRSIMEVNFDLVHCCTLSLCYLVAETADPNSNTEII